MNTFGMRSVRPAKGDLPTLLLMVSMTTGCGTKPPPPTVVTGTLQAAANVNPSASKRPSPLLVRIYVRRQNAACAARRVARAGHDGIDHEIGERISVTGLWVEHLVDRGRRSARDQVVENTAADRFGRGSHRPHGRRNRHRRRERVEVIGQPRGRRGWRRSRCARCRG